MRIIVPCAGRSSRYPDMAPKWMLPDHEGLLSGQPTRRSAHVTVANGLHDDG